MKFAPGQLRFIADVSTALKWSIEDRMLKGESFEDAKAAVIKQAVPTWKHLTPDNRQAIMIMANSLSPGDLSPSVVKELRRRWRQSVAEYTIKTKGKLRWYDRLLLRWFGVVW